jgi:tetratricopeptide (TPR) repeat protein
MDDAKPTEKSTSPRIQGITVPAIAAAIAALIIHFVLVFVLKKEIVPGYDLLNRMWGFDSLSFLPAASVVISYLAVILMCVPRFNQFVFDAAATFAPDDLIALLKRHKKKVFLLISIVVFLTVYYYKPLYTQFWSAQARANQAMQRDFQSAEYLSMFVTYRFQKFLSYFSEVTVQQSLALQGALAAAFYTLLSLLLSDELGKSMFAKCSIVLFHMTSGLLVLFSGPIGFHAMAAVTILAYLYASVLCLKDRLNIFVPFAAAMVSIGFNVLGIALIPSLFVLMYYKQLKSRADLKYSIVVLAIVATVIYTLQLYNDGLSIKLVSLLPLNARPPLMSMFDFRHMWEFLNGQMIVSGCGFVLFLYLAGRTVLTRNHVEAVGLFLTTASVFLVGIVFAWDVTLGTWEWSLNGIVAVSYNVAGIYLLVSRSGRPEQSPDLKYAIVLLIAFNLFNAVPWLAVNASEKSIDKIEQMVMHDPASFHVTTSSPLLELTLYSYQNRKKEQALKFATRAIAQLPNDPRSYSNMSILLIDIGRPDQAAQILRGMIDRFPYYAPAYRDLIGLSERRGDHTTTYIAAKKLYELFLRNRRPFIAALGNEQIVSYFRFLEQVERGELKNGAGADSVLRQMRLLQVKEKE